MSRQLDTALRQLRIGFEEKMNENLGPDPRTDFRPMVPPVAAKVSVQYSPATSSIGDYPVRPTMEKGGKSLFSRAISFFKVGRESTENSGRERT